MQKFLIAVGLSAVVCTSAFAGDAKKGEDKYKAVCSACHGPAGLSSNDMWPNLAGQKEKYLVKQIKAFKSGDRKDPSMAPMVSSLSDADIENVAAFISGLKGSK